MTSTAKLLQNSTVILGFPNQVVADVYMLAFESVISSDIVACVDLASVTEAMKAHPEACVVLEKSTPGSWAVLFDAQNMLARRAQLFVIGGGLDTLPQAGSAGRVELLPENCEMRQVVDRIEGALKLELSAQRYCRITLKSLLVRSERLRCDVFLKLSEEKYVKVLHANDRFEQEEYDRFCAKKVEHLYLLRGDFLGLMDDLLARAKKHSESPGAAWLPDSLSTTEAIFQIVQSAVETDGFTPQLRRMTEASVQLAITTIKRDPKLSDLISRLEHQKGSYVSWCSTAMSFLSCKLATLLGWQSEATFYKLSLASMLHDLTLSGDELARICTPAQLRALSADPKAKAAVLRHPLEAAQLAASFSEIPGEVGFIVEQHHERSDGTGFPRGIDHKDISSISALFIITHDIVVTMYDAPPDKFRISEFLAARESEKAYTRGGFGQVFRALQAACLEM